VLCPRYPICCHPVDYLNKKKTLAYIYLYHVSIIKLKEPSHIIGYFIYNTHLLMNTPFHPQVITASLGIGIKLNKKRKRNDKRFYNVMAKKVKLSKVPDDQREEEIPDYHSLPDDPNPNPNQSLAESSTHRQTQPKGSEEEIPDVVISLPDDQSLPESSTHRQTQPKGSEEEIPDVVISLPDDQSLPESSTHRQTQPKERELLDKYFETQDVMQV
jgi:hypothetical protein